METPKDFIGSDRQPKYRCMQCGAELEASDAPCPKGCQIAPNPEVVEAVNVNGERKVIHIEPEKPKGPQPTAQLVFTLFSDGNFNFTGPLEDHYACWGLIGLGIESLLHDGIRRQAQMERAMAAAQAAQPRKKPNVVRRFMDTVTGRNKAAMDERHRIAREAQEEAARLKAKREAEEQRNTSGTGEQAK